MNAKPLFTAVAALLLPASVYANQYQQSHGAHVHGIAELLVVQEGEQLDIELHSPAMNLLGFEQRAHTPEQQQALANARKLLSNVDSLFQFASANCRASEFSLNLSAAMSTRQDSEEADDHDEHNKAKHSEIEAHYQFRCRRPNTLHTLSTSLLQHFPGIHSLQVEWIVGGRQGATTLENDRHQVQFR